MGDARSFTVRIDNQTNTTWQRGGYRIDWGEWDVLPDERIEPHSSATWWKTVSAGFGTGTKGWLSYGNLDGPGAFAVDWNNPFVGSNEFSATPDGDATHRFEFLWGDPGGEDAFIVLTIRKIGGLPPPPAEGAEAPGPEPESIPKYVFE